ncbi:MAG: metallophosphoesterase [Lentisphaeria bacterium]|nr:metallophosphoesterase [Lentisphaeria bacterium]
MKKHLSLLLVLAALVAGAAEKPLAKAGFVSDTHVTPSLKSCIPLEKALRLCKAHKVDLLINCGDVADKPHPQAYIHYRNTVKKVYPQNKPFEMMPLAWHDVSCYGNYKTAWAKGWPHFKKALELEHGLYHEHTLAGYTFLLVPQEPDFVRFEKMIASACQKTPDKPVFLIDHYPASHTVFRSKTWGDARRRKILDKYPQIIQLCGHIHGNIRRENCIWQGNFTVVNIPCCRQSVGKVVPLNGQAVIMEIFKNKVVFRRFDVMTGKEYRPEDRWIIPLPHDPGTAPYTEKMRKRLPAPQFPKNSRITFKPDKIPFDSLLFTFPEAQGKYGVFTYSTQLFRKTPQGAWEKFMVKDMPGNYQKDPEQRITAAFSLSAGFFDSGREYKISITPVDFFGNSGKSIETVFKTPRKRQAKLLFESRDPMKELAFCDGFRGKKGFPVKKGFYFYHGDNARLLFPEKVWEAPAQTKFRFTIDLRMEQPGNRPWTLVLQDQVSRGNAFGRIYTKEGKTDLQRYVVEFYKKNQACNYYLLIREGKAGKIRFEYVKIEKL